MKLLAAIFCFLTVAAGAVAAQPADRSAIAIEGAYLLVQDDGFERIISFERGGNATHVSNQQSLIGFTTGKGAWKEIGPGRVRARVIDFNFNQANGEPMGSAVIIYELTFTGLKDGRYQSVGGSLTGEQYTAGQNPLSPTEAPARKFGIGFKGQRITAE
jgi:hypothetical protein